MNPYLPSWEYVPDGEPHLYNGRVYVYGSHDMFNGFVYCQNDYVCWSAPENDLTNWRYEGVIYQKTQDPYNADGSMCLYAPDVTQGPDGKYYLYYVLDKVDVVSVAVCDEPAGQYEFLGYVHYADGTLLGMKSGDDPQFDPAVLTEGERTYLYTGFGFAWDKTRHGPMATVLGKDMLTIEEAPRFILPSASYVKGSRFEGSEYEGHEFFEAASIRKVNGKYCFVYSSVKMHELCYAISDSPLSGFRYGGVIISNCDVGIDTYKPKTMPSYYPGNNHGGMLYANGEWYIFYHRHTNATEFSRQGCFEKIQILPDGRIPQVEKTTSNGCSPLPGVGEYPAYLACILIYGNPDSDNEPWRENRYPKITQDGRDGDKVVGYISSLNNGSVAGFKYFCFSGLHRISIFTRGYGEGVYEVRTELDGEALCSLPVGYTDVWKKSSVEAHIPDGVSALYFTFVGKGYSSLRSFVLE